MLTVGRLCVKTAGRDAMGHCVVVEEIDNNYVLVDGNVRRKKVNKNHLEPLTKTLDIKKGADTKTVQKALEDAGIVVKVKGEARTPKAQTKKADASLDKKADRKSDKKDSKK
jgi:large subunit ribosomal protein L14e